MFVSVGLLLHSFLSFCDVICVVLALLTELSCIVSSRFSVKSMEL